MKCNLRDKTEVPVQDTYGGREQNTFEAQMFLGTMKNNFTFAVDVSSGFLFCRISCKYG